MPQISRFFGIVIAMYFSDHAPPHFHAKYAEHEAVISVDALRGLPAAARFRDGVGVGGDSSG